MTTLHLFILGIVQGITEFLPVSSSAHLILVPRLLGDIDQGLMVDIGAHAGTLLAVVLVFWRETLQMLRGSIDTLRLRASADARLVHYLAIATIPGVLAGVALMDVQEKLMRHIPIIIVANVIWSLALWMADSKSPQDKNVQTDMTWKKALIIGCMQVISLIPGTSRSGITMTTSRYMGFSRLEAARFSLLLAIPITGGAVLLMMSKLFLHHPPAEEVHQLFLVAGVAFITALVAIFGLLKWLKRFSFLPFVLYRLGLAVFLTFWFWPF